METPHEDAEPKRDFAKMFDLDRSTLTKNMVDRMETCMREAEAAAAARQNSASATWMR